MNKLLHKIQHLFGWNAGTIETWYKDDKLMVGFKCNCGKMFGIEQIDEVIIGNYLKRKGGK